MHLLKENVTFQRDDLRSLRKTIRGSEAGKMLGEDIYLKGAEKKNYNCKFLK